MNLTASGGLPVLIKWAWPLVLSQQAFLIQARKLADPDDPTSKLIERITNEFLAHLEDGPFLASSDVPTFADLAAYPQFMLPYVAGLKGNEPFFDNQKITDWVNRVDQHLAAARPKLFPPVAVRRTLPG